MSMEDIMQLQSEINEKIEKEGDQSVREGFKKIFADIPRLNAITWRQYVPSFNDGDACVFTISGDFYFQIEDLIKPGFSADDAGLSPYDGEREYEDEDSNDDEDESSELKPSKDNVHFYNSNDFENKIPEYGRRNMEAINFLTDEEYEKLVTFERLLWKCDNLLQRVFGDNADVTVKRDGTIINDYYCCD